MRINIKRILIFLALIFVSIVIFKQKSANKSIGSLSYTIDFNVEDINESNKTDPIIAGLDLFDEINEASKKLIFNLNFSNLEASFSLNKNVDVNDKMSKLAIVLSGGKGFFYNNYHNRVRQVDAFNNKYLIKYNNIKSTDWVLKEDMKIINGYKCNKAILKKSDSNSEEIIAWYSPELPYRFGPRGIGNLPGLILELSVTNRVEIIFTASNLLFNDLENISEPLEGIKITRNEFNVIKQNKFLELIK